MALNLFKLILVVAAPFLFCRAANAGEVGPRSWGQATITVIIPHFTQAIIAPLNGEKVNLNLTSSDPVRYSVVARDQSVAEGAEKGTVLEVVEGKSALLNLKDPLPAGTVLMIIPE